MPGALAITSPVAGLTTCTAEARGWHRSTCAEGLELRRSQVACQPGDAPPGSSSPSLLQSIPQLLAGCFPALALSLTQGLECYFTANSRHLCMLWR